MMNFNVTPNLSDEIICINALEENDFEALFEIASDKLLWAAHPKKDRYKRDVFEKWFKDALSSKTALLITEKNTGKAIGSSRYYELDEEKKEVAIGYTFIGTAYWGGEINGRVKALMINHAFETFDKVWFHVDPSNIRSQKAVLKLGASYSHIEKLKNPNDNEDYYCYELNKVL
jgi:RimJ/RimL family protein N-acetyltransferase